MTVVWFDNLQDALDAAHVTLGDGQAPEEVGILHEGVAYGVEAPPQPPSEPTVDTIPGPVDG